MSGKTLKLALVAMGSAAIFTGAALAQNRPVPPPTASVYAFWHRSLLACAWRFCAGSSVVQVLEA